MQLIPRFAPRHVPPALVAWPGAESASRIDFWLPPPPEPVETLAGQYLAHALRLFPEPHFDLPLRWAACQALELADSSGFALLVFPDLFSELAVEALLKA